FVDTAGGGEVPPSWRECDPHADYTNRGEKRYSARLNERRPASVSYQRRTRGASGIAGGLRRLAQPAEEEDAAGPVVADEEQEGVVGHEVLRLGSRPLFLDHRGRRGGLGAFLVHLHERLMQDVLDPDAASGDRT